MKKKYLTALLLILLVNVTTAQVYLHEFGKYSNEDFALKACSFDTTAEAVVIYDIGNSSFDRTDYGYYLSFVRTMKIKVFTKAGFNLADFTIPIYEGSEGPEIITEIMGNTYNLENGILRTTPMNPKETYAERINEHWVLKKFAVPDIKEGSVFEVCYKIRSPYIFNLRDWEFQREIPVIYSEYTTIMNQHFEYVYNLQGSNKFDEYKTYSLRNGVYQPGVREVNEDLAYFFVLKNIPAFKEDPFISSSDDYKIKLNFQLSKYVYDNGAVSKIITTWPELNKDLLSSENFGKFLKNSEKKAEELLQTMNLLSNTPLEKAIAIHEWVSGNINYNDYNGLYAVKSVKEFLNQKVGNAAEINLFFTGMLRAAGIEAEPVIISTRDHGKLKIDYPFVDAFNYVVVSVLIDGQIMILDATESLLGFNEIPPRCLNGEGLLVKSGPEEWVRFNNKVNSKHQYRIDITPEIGNSVLNQKFRLITTGYEAAKYRSEFIHEHDELKKRLIHQGYDSGDSLKSFSLYDINAPFEISFDENLPLDLIDNKIIIEPFGGKAINENPFKQPSRNYPVDFTYKQSISFETVINIPIGYGLISKPENLIVNNSTTRIVYTVDDSVPGIVKITGLYEFKKDMYEAADYLNLKGYYKMVIDKFNEKIALKMM